LRPNASVTLRDAERAGANFSVGEGGFMELYCNLHIGVSNELLWGLEGLVGKK